MDLIRNKLIGSIVFPNNPNVPSPLMVVLCGLPDSGLSTMSISIERILKWKNNNVKIFSSNNYNLIYELNNKKINSDPKLDFNIFEKALNFCNKKNNLKNISIFDATNSTVLERIKIKELCHFNKIQLVFVESNISNFTIHEFLKTEWLNHPKDCLEFKDHKDAYDFFLSKINNYKSCYVSLENDPNKRNYSFISIDNFGVYNHLIDSYIPLTISSFITSKFKKSIGNTIYVCRHGESEANILDLIGGNYDLTENGREFGKKLGLYMVENEKNGIQIWTSSLIRTINTAKECQRVANGNDSILELNELDEIHAGSFEEFTFTNLKMNHPEVNKARQYDKYNFVYPNRGESYSMLAKRIEPVLLSIERQTCNVLIICHTAVLRMIVSYLLDLDREKSTTMDVPLNRIYKIERDYCKNNLEIVDL